MKAIAFLAEGEEEGSVVFLDRDALDASTWETRIDVLL